MELTDFKNIAALITIRIIKVAPSNGFWSACISVTISTSWWRHETNPVALYEYIK